MASEDNFFFYEDEVFRVNGKGQIQFGTVVENSELVSSNDESSDNEYEEEDYKMKKGHIRVSWHPSGLTEVLSESKVGLADRSLMPGDVVKQLAQDKNTQRGYCNDVKVFATVQIVGTKLVIENLPTSQLSPLAEFSRDLAVYLDHWVGVIRDVHMKLLIVCSDGSKAYVSDPNMLKALLSQKRRKCHQHEDFPRMGKPDFYPGQKLLAPRYILVAAQWLGKSPDYERLVARHKHLKVTVETMEVDYVEVTWRCTAYTGDSVDSREPVVKGEELKRLRVLNHFEACTNQVGDRVTYRVTEEDNLLSLDEWKDRKKRTLESAGVPLPVHYRRKASRRKPKKILSGLPFSDRGSKSELDSTLIAQDVTILDHSNDATPAELLAHSDKANRVNSIPVEPQSRDLVNSHQCLANSIEKVNSNQILAHSKDKTYSSQVLPRSNDLVNSNQILAHSKDTLNSSKVLPRSDALNSNHSVSELNDASKKVSDTTLVEESVDGLPSPKVFHFGQGSPAKGLPSNDAEVPTIHLDLASDSDGWDTETSFESDYDDSTSCCTTDTASVASSSRVNSESSNVDSWSTPLAARSNSDSSNMDIRFTRLAARSNSESSNVDTRTTSLTARTTSESSNVDTVSTPVAARSNSESSHVDIECTPVRSNSESSNVDFRTTPPPARPKRRTVALATRLMRRKNKAKNQRNRGNKVQGLTYKGEDGLGSVIGRTCVVEILCTQSYADVVWQDGTMGFDISSLNLYPIHYLDDKEFFPGDFVVKGEEVEMEETEEEKWASVGEYGVVAEMNHEARTARIQWFQVNFNEGESSPQCRTESEMSVYDIKDHPDFQFRPGSVVMSMGGIVPSGSGAVGEGAESQRCILRGDPDMINRMLKITKDNDGQNRTSKPMGAKDQSESNRTDEPDPTNPSPSAISEPNPKSACGNGSTVNCCTVGGNSVTANSTPCADHNVPSNDIVNSTEGNSVIGPNHSRPSNVEINSDTSPNQAVPINGEHSMVTDDTNATPLPPATDPNTGLPDPGSCPVLSDVEEERVYVGQVLDNFPEGRIKVWWVNGSITSVWPQDLYKIGDYNSDGGELWASSSEDSWETETEDESMFESIDTRPEEIFLLDLVTEPKTDSSLPVNESCDKNGGAETKLSGQETGSPGSGKEKEFELNLFRTIYKLSHVLDVLERNMVVSKEEDGSLVPVLRFAHKNLSYLDKLLGTDLFSGSQLESILSRIGATDSELKKVTATTQSNGPGKSKGPCPLVEAESSDDMVSPRDDQTVPSTARDICLATLSQITHAGDETTSRLCDELELPEFTEDSSTSEPETRAEATESHEDVRRNTNVSDSGCTPICVTEISRNFLNVAERRIEKIDSYPNVSDVERMSEKKIDSNSTVSGVRIIPKESEVDVDSKTGVSDVARIGRNLEAWEIAEAQFLAEQAAAASDENVRRLLDAGCVLVETRWKASQMGLSCGNGRGQTDPPSIESTSNSKATLSMGSQVCAILRGHLLLAHDEFIVKYFPSHHQLYLLADYGTDCPFTPDTSVPLYKNERFRSNLKYLKSKLGPAPPAESQIKTETPSIPLSQPSIAQSTPSIEQANSLSSHTKPSIDSTKPSADDTVPLTASQQEPTSSPFQSSNNQSASNATNTVSSAIKTSSQPEIDAFAPNSNPSIAQCEKDAHKASTGVDTLAPSPDVIESHDITNANDSKTVENDCELAVENGVPKSMKESREIPRVNGPTSALNVGNRTTVIYELLESIELKMREATRREVKVRIDLELKETQDVLNELRIRLETLQRKTADARGRGKEGSEAGGKQRVEVGGGKDKFGEDGGRLNKVEVGGGVGNDKVEGEGGEMDKTDIIGEGGKDNVQVVEGRVGGASVKEEVAEVEKELCEDIVEFGEDLEPWDQAAIDAEVQELRGFLEAVEARILRLRNTTDRGEKVFVEVKKKEQESRSSVPLIPSPEVLSEGFTMLESVGSYPHKYLKRASAAGTLSKVFFKALRKEMMLLRSSLPPGIWVRGFEDRLDLLSVMILGPCRTPYEDGLFYFDFHLPAEYPQAPPVCHYLSYCSDRLNPNLYETGKVCVSLLGTWTGRGTEVWTAQSTLLQILISIQGLILNAEPYFNEAGYERQRTSRNGQENARMYNEMVLLKLVTAMGGVARNPPSVWAAETADHFRRCAKRFGDRLEYWAKVSMEVTSGKGEEESGSGKEKESGSGKGGENEGANAGKRDEEESAISQQINCDSTSRLEVKTNSPSNASVAPSNEYSSHSNSSSVPSNESSFHGNTSVAPSNPSSVPNTESHSHNNSSSVPSNESNSHSNAPVAPSNVSSSHGNASSNDNTLEFELPQFPLLPASRGFCLTLKSLITSFRATVKRLGLVEASAEVDPALDTRESKGNCDSGVKRSEGRDGEPKMCDDVEAKKVRCDPSEVNNNKLLQEL